MTRTLMIATVAPYPKNVGKRVMLGGMCDYFAETSADGDFRVVSFEPLPAELGTGRRLHKPGRVRKLWNLLWHTVVRRDKSMQEALFWSPSAQRQIDRAIADFAPDVVVYDTVRAGQYLRPGHRGAPFHAVLYLDDLFSVRYERMLATMDRFPGVPIDALGNFAANLPPWLLKAYRALPSFQPWLLRRERALIARTEDTQPAAFDLALLVSDSEVVRLRERTDFTHVHALRPYMPAKAPRPARRWDGSATFVFLGSLNLPHNAVSLEVFVAMHLERLAARVPGFRLVVVGRHASPKLKALAARFPAHLQLAGFVEDLTPVLASCAGMIAPLLFGSGVKIKVIDAMRAGVPVIATDFGAEGIVADGRKGLIVENDLDAYAARCRALLDPAVNANESVASRQLFDAHYAPRVVGRDYARYFGGAVTADPHTDEARAA